MQPRVGCSSNQPGYLLVLFNKLLIIVYDRYDKSIEVLPALFDPPTVAASVMRTNSQAMYKAKREEHFAHLIKIAQLDDASIMIELVTRLIIQLLELLKLHRAVLLNATLTRPDMAPAEVDAAKAYAMVVETCPFLADLILRFPDSAREVLAPQRSRHNELIAWAFEFTRQSKFPSETDLKLLTLAEQELNLIPRPDNYVNPFADATKSRQVAELRELERRRAKQEMRRNLRRPRLTPRTEL
ncbi:hypothetical protein AAHC03_0627 [Spirometra sp. Aus1]